MWTLREKIIKLLIPIETKFFKRTAEYTLFDLKTNEEILEELKVETANERKRKYK
jgi:hypothetical protein